MIPSCGCDGRTGLLLHPDQGSFLLKNRKILMILTLGLVNYRFTHNYGSFSYHSDSNCIYGIRDECLKREVNLEGANRYLH